MITYHSPPALIPTLSHLCHNFVPLLTSDTVISSRSKEASSVLKKHNWRLDAAIDAYYSSSGASGNPAKSTTDPATMEKRIVDLFNKYKGIYARSFG